MKAVFDVDIELRTRQYIPEDSELHIRRIENLMGRNRIENTAVHPRRLKFLLAAVRT
jgi:hypothetical protein